MTCFAHFLVQCSCAPSLLPEQASHLRHAPVPAASGVSGSKSARSGSWLQICGCVTCVATRPLLRGLPAEAAAAKRNIWYHISYHGKSIYDIICDKEVWYQAPLSYEMFYDIIPCLRACYHMICGVSFNWIRYHRYIYNIMHDIIHDMIFHIIWYCAYWYCLWYLSFLLWHHRQYHTDDIIAGYELWYHSSARFQMMKIVTNKYC